MFDLKPSTLRVNGYDVAYIEAGQGEPFVLVHGSLCDFRRDARDECDQAWGV